MVGGVGLAVFNVLGRHWDFAGAFAGWTNFFPSIIPLTFAVRARLHFFIAEMLVNVHQIAARR